MIPHTHWPRLALALLAVLALVPPAAAGAAGDFPPVTPEERSLTGVPDYPEAAAVILFSNASFRMMDLARREQYSTLQVHERVKILTQEGVGRYGEFAVYHSGFTRLKKVEGRTVLPAGRQIPLPEDALFSRKASDSRRLYVTAAAFPEVAVGAILDFRYEIRFDSYLFLEPWLFQREIPVLHSEISYWIPEEIGFRGWQRDPNSVGLRSRTEGGVRGRTLTVWADDLPPIPVEPYGFPAVDLAARYMVVPAVYAYGAGREPLLDTWKDTCELIQEQVYNDAQRTVGPVKRRARQLTDGLEGELERARAVYRFVRDEIETEPWPGVFVDGESDVAGVLDRGSGDSAEKALLLAGMLSGLKVDADLVWVAARSEGLIDPQLANPMWFDRMIVRARIGGEELFLDPSSSSLGFGFLDPDYEGTPAVVHHPRKPELIALPITPFEDNLRRAELELALDADGRISGTGTLTATGHHAWRRFEARGSGDPAESWTEWLEERLPTFAVSEVEVEESVDERRSRVRFALAQRDEEVLGDEATFNPSRPLGPVSQPFTLPPARRRSPVSFAFGDRDEVQLTLTWPEGWELEAMPPGRSLDNGAGALMVEVEADPETRRLSYSRRFDIRSAQFLARQDYLAVRELFEKAAKSDALGLVLVQP